MDKTSGKIILFFLIFFVFTQKTQAQSDSSKSLHNVLARSRNTDIKHIALDLQFDWPKKQAHGTASITLSLFNAADRIMLDAGMLTINSISLQTGKALKFAYDGGDRNDGLQITLDRVYQPGENLIVKIDYHTNWVNAIDPNSLGGNFGKGLRFCEPTGVEPMRRKQLWSVGEPESNRYWFPGYDSPNDLRTTELTATVEKNLTVISNGVLTEPKSNADGTHTFHWRMDTPYANHLTSIAIGEYTIIKQNYEGLSLQSYSYPDEVDATTASVERLPDMIKFFSEKTGVKYPYPSYSQVFVQNTWSWMGNSTASTITENMVDDGRTHDDFLYLWDVTEGEALAHQWFGSYLSPRSWSHAWLNKGFAQYFSGLYNEQKNGRDEFLIWQHSFTHGASLGDWSAGVRQPVVDTSYDDVTSFIGGNSPYLRGAAVLHTLRKHLGDDVWWKVIRQYLKTNANSLVTTEDFRKAVEDASGQPMDWFFDQWLYKVGHPVFTITKTYDVAKKQLTLNVKQTQQKDSITTYPQVEFFQGKIDIEIDGRIEQVWLEPKGENVFTFNYPQAPAFVNFDFESTWIKEVTFEKSWEEQIQLLLNSKDALARISAITDLTAIASEATTPAVQKEKIYAAFRTVALGNSYWRIRMNAMAQLVNTLAAQAKGKPLVLDKATTSMLLTIIKNDKSWIKASAIRCLGLTNNPQYADLYLKALADPSDRVINTAAVALGKSKSPKAYDALAKLVSKPSWKNQSLMSALNGLQQLGDPRGYDIAFNALADVNQPRWTLPTPPIWDYRVFAAQTIAALGKSEHAFPLVFDRFKKSLAENDSHVIFNYALLIATLADARGQEAFDLLKVKFKVDENAMAAVSQYEAQFQSAIKK